MSSTAFRGPEYQPAHRPGFAGRYDSTHDSIAWLDHLSRLFDTAFILPGTNVRYGIEAILRLVPGIGDVAASALSAFLLYQAYRLGVPRRLFLRMLANVAVEGVVGSVPFIGDAFDVAFRANRRNVRLLREHFERVGRI